MSWSGFWWLESSSSKPLHFFNLLPSYRPAAQRSVLELTYCWCLSEGNSLYDACGLCGVGATWGEQDVCQWTAALCPTVPPFCFPSARTFACRVATSCPQCACTPCVSTRRLMRLEFHIDTKPLPAVIAAGNVASVTTVINLEHDLY